MINLFSRTILALLLIAPAYAQDITKVEQHENVFTIEATDEGALVTVVNGYSIASGFTQEVVLRVGEIEVTVLYHLTNNTNSDPSDLLEVVEVTEGYMAYPVFQSVNEEATASIRILPNLMM